MTHVEQMTFNDVWFQVTLKRETFSALFVFQRVDDKEHSVRLAIGNGLRADVWRTFLQRFGNIEVREFYASTEGNVGFLNYAGRIGAIGRVSYLHKVRLGLFDLTRRRTIQRADDVKVPLSNHPPACLWRHVTSL